MGQLALTVDVDGEAGLPDGGRHAADLLTARSERLYGLRRGLPRILALLDELDAVATFYVPGVVAERHREAIAELAAGRHEIGHHGHAHRRPDTMSAQEQRDDLEAGIDVLTEVCGSRPMGYRAPGWELTPATLDGLVDLGFAYDSSLMQDDRPYWLRPGALLELPVHWSLDDAPHFAACGDPSGLLAVWLAELEIAARESRLITITLHPEILGRPHRVDVLRRTLERARQLQLLPVTHGAAATGMARA